MWYSNNCLTRFFMNSAVVSVCFLLIALSGHVLRAEIVKYARFQIGDTVAYGIVEGDQIRQLDGDLFGEWEKTSKRYALQDVRLLVPSTPQHVFAMAGNYKSHLGKGGTTTTITTKTKVVFDPETKQAKTSTSTTEDTRVPGVVPKKMQIPQPFFKSTSSLTAHETNIVIPKNSRGIVHFEAEMVIVIGRLAHNVSRDTALDYVLGVTCGNDVSEREWQKGDVQWWRAKGSDTFGPCGPYIVSGVDYDNLQMTLRLNGKVMQDESTSHLIHDVASCVSHISHHTTLSPGDLIFTGTPGSTSVIKPGDEVEIELEYVGTLRNRVVAEPH
ncbi:MAG: fumarylacetoacetate hydrolase family protein [Pirellulaceae bacterium]|nr:fumarylacetoacetate hydrolase family protein [Pirellulaceae bacterium]